MSKERLVLLFSKDQDSLHVVRAGDRDEILDFLTRMDRFKITLATARRAGSWIYSYIYEDVFLSGSYDERLWRPRGGGS